MRRETVAWLERSWRAAVDSWPVRATARKNCRSSHVNCGGLFIAVPLCSKTNNELRNFPHLPSRHHRYEQKADATPFKLAR
jgi:hypothetical protein